MAMNTERSSKALHNFAMPGQLRWGNQRFLRCMKVNSDAQISSLHRFNTADTDSHYDQSHHHHRRSISILDRRAGIRGGDRRESSSDGSDKVGSTPPPPPADHGIAAIREKVVLDLQTAAVKMKDAIFNEGRVKGDVSVLVSPPPAAAVQLPQGETNRPWSLRTRRASCKTTPSSVNGGENGLREDVGKPSSGAQPTRPSAAAGNSSRLRSGGGEAEGSEKREREKFSVALSKRAIEEDFMTMVNHRPPRRPKKRPKMIQKQLDMLFPGLWLTEITADMYKVTESAP